ncbi:DUF1236 domain-containing protein [Pseudorhodoplanes sinuspersici]|uniref:Uncharacterized protein n=1 Tax=Pseudorhodoplanes sinuspersici TaxID=1235591 RepID=A0A1W6ZYW0_9HYPH|nr:DUF1236 domain-containing protein [Pseudorhodoplanes sinuspersici]ARQ02599.1 hypothetical protein CAK95_28435 [Pseudorhodoplanes sinuspersici]RKE74458.1 uncharacterized protein DUF1236 [Pseudorhodoplanes sinuspersici]
MKSILLAGVAAIAIVAAPLANAQTVGVGVGPVGAGIDFSPEQRTIVREYVKRERPVTFREQVTVGTTLPEDVEIRSAPADWGPSASKYRYVYSGDRVYFVEPDSRRVVHILD